MRRPSAPPQPPAANAEPPAAPIRASATSAGAPQAPGEWPAPPRRLAAEIRQQRPFASTAEELFLALQRTAALHATALATALRAVELSPSQYNVLRILRGSHPTPLACSEVGARMVTPDPDVTRLLDRLEQRGLIARSRAQRDRRVVEVSLAEPGFAALERADPLVDQLFGVLFAGVDPRALTPLILLLDHLRGQLDAWSPPRANPAV